MGLFREFLDAFRSSYRSAYFGAARRQLRAMREEELSNEDDLVDGDPSDLDPGVEIEPGITSSAYRASCKRRFGTSNPELMRNPIWEWMVRTGENPFVARRSLGLETDFESGTPDWCFDRMGAARVEMPDGRIITIAGEHEDSYDPDFCIYNDVVVQNGDAVEIYGYPRSTFPPTDFHSATLVDNSIYIVGSLGYHDERGGSLTPVFRLDPNDYRIERVETTGESPGWIHKHRAEFLADTGVIEITGGERILGHGDSERFRDNFDTYRLRVDDGTWQRVTHNSGWRQFSLKYADDERTIGDLGWYTGKVLKQLGYPCKLYENNEENEKAKDPSNRSHVIIVDGVRVLCGDRYDEIRVTIQGQLEQAKIDDLLSMLKELARGTHRVVTKIEEL